MGVFRGKAAFTWVDPAVSMTEQVLLLREPIRETRGGYRASIYVAESLDFQSRQVFAVGTGVQEITCRLRFVDDMQGLVNFLAAGANKVTLIYHPDLSDPVQTHSYKLIAPLAPFQVGLDGDSGVPFGDGEVTLTLRETS